MCFPPPVMPAPPSPSDLRKARIAQLAAMGHDVEYEAVTHTYIVDGRRVDPLDFEPGAITPVKDPKSIMPLPRKPVEMKAEVRCNGCGARHREPTCPYCGV